MTLDLSVTNPSQPSDNLKAPQKLALGIVTEAASMADDAESKPEPKAMLRNAIGGQPPQQQTAETVNGAEPKEVQGGEPQSEQSLAATEAPSGHWASRGCAWLSEGTILLMFPLNPPFFRPAAQPLSLLHPSLAGFVNYGRNLRQRPVLMLIPPFILLAVGFTARADAALPPLSQHGTLALHVNCLLHASSSRWEKSGWVYHGLMLQCIGSIVESTLTLCMA